jgi:hypothetical protein
VKIIINLVLAIAIFSNSNLALANLYANGDDGLTYLQSSGGKGSEIASPEREAPIIDQPEIKIHQMSLQDGELTVDFNGDEGGRVVARQVGDQVVGTINTSSESVSFSCHSSANLSVENYLDLCSFGDEGNVTNFIPFFLGMFLLEAVVLGTITYFSIGPGKR